MAVCVCVCVCVCVLPIDWDGLEELAVAALQAPDSFCIHLYTQRE